VKHPKGEGKEGAKKIKADKFPPKRTTKMKKTALGKENYGGSDRAEIAGKKKFLYNCKGNRA